MDFLCHNVSVALTTLLLGWVLPRPSFAYVIKKYAISYSFMFYTCLMTGVRLKFCESIITMPYPNDQ